MHWRMNAPTTTTGLAEVRQEIARACREAGRDPSGVTLVAVSKTFGAEAIAPVIAAGQTRVRRKPRAGGEDQMAAAAGADAGP